MPLLEWEILASSLNAKIEDSSAFMTVFKDLRLKSILHGCDETCSPLWNGLLRGVLLIQA